MEQALPEFVENSLFDSERKPLLEVLTGEQHSSVMETVFADGDIIGYDKLLKALQKGYESNRLQTRAKSLCGT